MGLFSGLGSFFGPIGTLVGGAFDSASSENSAQSAVDQQMQNTRTLRQTAYQDTTQDLKAAGLNPMLAYSNGATAAANPPLVNKGLQGAQQTSAQSSTENLRADTENKNASRELMEAQAAEIRSKIPLNTNSAENVGQQTKNLIANIDKIKAEINNIQMDSQLKGKQHITEVEKANLLIDQQTLTQAEQRLAEGKLTEVEQSVLLKEVETLLKKYEIPGAKNAAQFETDMGVANKAGGAAGKVLGTIINGTRAIRK